MYEINDKNTFIKKWKRMGTDGVSDINKLALKNVPNMFISGCFSEKRISNGENPAIAFMNRTGGKVIANDGKTLNLPSLFGKKDEHYLWSTSLEGFIVYSRFINKIRVDNIGGLRSRYIRIWI